MPEERKLLPIVERLAELIDTNKKNFKEEMGKLFSDSYNKPTQESFQASQFAAESGRKNIEAADNNAQKALDEINEQLKISMTTLKPAMARAYKAGELTFDSWKDDNGIFREIYSVRETANIDDIKDAVRSVDKVVDGILNKYLPRGNERHILMRGDNPFHSLGITFGLLKGIAEEVKQEHSKVVPALIEEGSFRIEGQGRVVPRTIEEQAKLAVSGSAKDIKIAPEGGVATTGIDSKILEEAKGRK